jgi:predicted transcriptional regulator
MKRTGIPYLPVVFDKRVIGLLKAQTVKAAMGTKYSQTLSALDLMKPNPTVVSPDTSLFEAIDGVPESAYGCTVVQKPSGEVTGIFSSLDALAVMKSLTHKKRALAAA